MPAPTRLRRVWRWTWRSLAVLLLVVLGLLGWLHTEGGQEMLRGRVEKALGERVRGTVELGGLEAALFGDLVLRDLVVTDAQGQRVLALERLEVTPDWEALVDRRLVLERLRLQGLDLALRLPVAGLLVPQPDAGPGRDLVLKALEVRGSRADVVAANGNRFHLEGIEVDAEITASPSARTFDVAVGRLAAELTFEAPGREAKDLRLGLGSAKIRLQGEALEAELGALAAGPASLVALRVQGRLPREGRLQGETTATLEGLEVDGAKLKALAPGLACAPDLNATLSIGGPPERLGVTGAADTAGGRVRISGTLDLREPRDPAYDMRVDVSQVDTTKLGCPGLTPVSTDLNLVFEGRGATKEALASNLRLQVGPTTVLGHAIDRVELVGRAEAARLAVERLSIEVLGHRVDVDGKLDPASRSFSAHLKSGAELAKLLARLREAGLKLPVWGPEEAGKLEVDLSVGGRLAEPGAGLAEATLAGTVRVAELALAGAAAREIVTTADLRVAQGKPYGTLTLTAQGLSRAERAMDRLRAVATLDGDALKLELEVEDTAHALQGGATLAGRLDRATLAVDARIERLFVSMGGRRIELAKPFAILLPSLADLASRPLGFGGLVVDVGGGRLTLGGEARFQEAASGARPQLAGWGVNADLAGLDLASFTGGRVRGRLGGKLSLDGVPGQSLSGSFDLTLAMGDLRVGAKGKLAPGQLVADLDAWLGGERLGTGHFEVPLSSGPRPALDRHGELRGNLSFAVDPARWLPRWPDALRGAEARGDIQVQGSAARPRLALDARLSRAEATLATAAVTARLEPAARAFEGVVSLAVPSLRALGAPVDLAANARLVLGRERTEMTAGLLRDGTAIAALTATLPGAKEIASGARDPARRARWPVSARLDLPRQALADWAAVRPALAGVQGTIQGSLSLGHTLGAPEVGGSLHVGPYGVWSGDPQELVLEPLLEGDLARLRATIRPVGDGPALVSFDLSAAWHELLQPARGVVVRAALSAEKAPLVRILPDLAQDTAALAISGQVDADWQAELLVTKTAGGFTLDPRAMSGGLSLSGGGVSLPGTTRRFKDIELAVEASPDALVLERLVLVEADEEKPARTLRAHGELGWVDLRPRTARLTLETVDWLAMGALDAPEGEIQAVLEATADLTAPTPQVRVKVERLQALAPSRFKRDHYQQTVGDNDLIFLEPGQEPGRLPYLPPPPPAPLLGGRSLDVHIDLAKGVEFVREPLHLFADGALELRFRPEGPTLTGQVEVRRGEVRALGKTFNLVEGKLRLPGPLAEWELDVIFRRPVEAVAQPDLPKDDGSGAATTGVRVQLSKSGETISWLGAGGPFLVDQMALANAGHPLFSSAPDRPTSATTRLPHQEQSLVLAFLSTNFRQLLFMRRFYAHSGTVDGDERYGQLQYLLSERRIFAEDLRLRLIRQPDRAVTSATELQLDWLWTQDPHRYVGLGARLGEDMRAGLEFFVEFATQD
jgi:hypothetical protein